MLLKKAVLKLLVNQTIKAIEKVSDKKIARDHHNRIKELENEVKELKKDSHPPQEYVCCKNCGCRIAKTKNK